jgi:hypothetical protein
MTDEVVGSGPARQATGAVSGVGLAVGVCAAALYALWALVVASGAAQSLFDFIAVRLHVGPVFVIEQVDPARAAILALLAGVIGYAIGAACAGQCHRATR